VAGYPGNKGIIPRSCEEIFRRIDERVANPANSIQHQVTLSMIEIYNECIQDLFVKAPDRPKGGLDVKEHPKLGVTVFGMQTVPVSSYKEIEQWIDIGTKNRTIG
jgi:hypothetical protein